MKSRASRLRTRWRAALLVGLSSILFVPLGRADEGQAPANIGSERPVVAGQRLFICGHSFHVFLAKPLEAAAKAAGIADHKTVGIQSIGGSSVSQHWRMPNAVNKVKKALQSGGVDVLTLSPNWSLPDEAIDRFVDLALEHNPNARVMLQQSWIPWDGLKPPLKISENQQRDRKTIAQLRPPLEEATAIAEKQVLAINRRRGRQVVFIVPVGDAVLALREKIIRGEVPGIARQSELFKDAMGHANPPVCWLAAYCHFAAIYRRSPVGLTGLENPPGENAKPLHRLLQELAWKAVVEYPFSGVTNSGER